MSILIGTQGWNYAAWVGPFYPPGTRASEFLAAYAKVFRAVEVDSTFYAVPDARAVRAWAERTPPDFTFALKMPKEVTHELRLRDADSLVRDFLERVSELGPKLGPILLQMGPDFAPDELPALEQFLPRLPRGLRFALELRERWMGPRKHPAPLAGAAGAVTASHSRSATPGGSHGRRCWSWRSAPRRTFSMCAGWGRTARSPTTRTCSSIVPRRSAPGPRC